MSDKDKALAQNEVDILTRIDHPNIIKYIEHYKRDGILVIVMEYADGGDLYGRIQKQKKNHPGVRFSEDQVMSWFIQMLLAVKNLHDHRILHRDLKSANIFLTKDDVVKVGDFGFGKVMANTIAQAKTLCGTPYYFSPELCMGRPYNNKTDIWALGCILAEMCLCDHAYNAKNIKDLMKRVCKGTYQPIPSFYCPDLHHLIAGMLTKDQVARPNIKSILAMDYVQSKLRAFSNVPGNGVVANTPKGSRPTTANSDSEKRDVQAVAAQKEMEIWAARDEEMQKKVEKSRREEELKRKKAEEAAKEEEMAKYARMKADKTKMMNRDQLKEFLKGPPPDEVIALRKSQAQGTGTGTSPGTGTQRPPSSGGRPGTGGRRNPPPPSGPPGDLLDEFANKQNLPGGTRRSLDPALPPSGGNARPPPPPQQQAPPAPPSNDDPFDENAGWQSIVQRQSREGSRVVNSNDKTQAEDEFGNFAAKSIPSHVHASIMQHVNASLLPRPGTASREKRAAERARASQEKALKEAAQEAGHDNGDDDFSDAAATMGSQHLRSLLVQELGNDVVSKALDEIQREEEATAHVKLEQLIGKDKAKELGPLFDKLLASESGT
eukprot:TRINITY_DN51456_c0_g1_i2.p1 TRINITY_DN51456_c0_g1~~TRINITY_DN51456_c0_g1_i2.p1  ORF type:complete len:605 (+),score=81.08 TRINITY_DN51456_c0_g1_i2:221-2035(+)